MKIENIGNTASSKSTKKTRKSSGNVSFDSLLEAQDEEIETSDVVRSRDIANINPLFFLQDISLQGQGKKRSIKNARDILSSLEQLKLDILNGNVNIDRLTSIEEILRKNREDVYDEGLSRLLNEIEVRAAVEIAKYNVKNDFSSN